MKPYYNPRNQNPRIDGNRQSWSTAFEGMVERKRTLPTVQCGFVLKKDGQ